MSQQQRTFLSWEELKIEFPSIANVFLQECKSVNGFIPREYGFVYVIHAIGSNYYKIGKSINPDRRILQIAPKMPFDVCFAAVWRSDFMSMAESHLHRMFANERVNGEWFELCEGGVEILLGVTITPFTVRYAYFDALSVKLTSKALSQRDLYRSLCERTFPTFDEDGYFTITWIEEVFFQIGLEEMTSGLPSQIGGAL